jgi:nitrite reductase/ring-hydroxylating ferredoxin subunit
VPTGDAQLGETPFEEWLSNQVAAPTSQSTTAAASDSTAPQDNEFRVSTVPDGSGLLVGDVSVFNVDGRLCATQEKCTHRQGPLSKGKLDGSTVTCPWHGSQFNVCTGELLRGPATDPLKTYRVVVDGDIGRVEAGDAVAAKSAS